MLTHETSPVSGASVMGMTSGVCHGQRCLPAGVPGISMVLSQKDRLWPKGGTAGYRLHQGKPEPGEDDKAFPTVASLKVAWP
jgi:hypothetical protein